MREKVTLSTRVFFGAVTALALSLFLLTIGLSVELKVFSWVGSWIVAGATLAIVIACGNDRNKENPPVGSGDYRDQVTQALWRKNIASPLDLASSVRPPLNADAMMKVIEELEREGIVQRAAGPVGLNHLMVMYTLA